MVRGGASPGGLEAAGGGVLGGPGSFSERFFGRERGIFFCLRGRLFGRLQLEIFARENP